MIRTSCFSLGLCVAALGCGVGASRVGGGADTAQAASRVDASSFIDKVTAGYQAWFSCPTDGSGGWTHWSYQTPARGRVTFELYPDVREYDASVLCDSQLGPLNNGQRARLYNAASENVIDTHFRWMREYGIDGVGLQRFVVGIGDSRGVLITQRVRAAAERHGRIFYVMYDISGARSDWVDVIKRDWEVTMEQQLRVTDSPQYARQGGRPVVNVWGLGVGDRPGTAAEALDLVSWFKARGVYVVGGVPYWWRDPQGGKPGFDGVYAALNMVQPWAVGTFGSDGDADGHFASLVAQDVALTRSRGQDYQRVLWSGFAWSNWNGGARNAIPRRAGRFFWHQSYLAARNNLSTYIAMFDEYDEGTAIAKAAEDVSMIPNDQYFLTLDADGTHLSSDFYLRLAGAATRMLQGRAAVVDQVPVPNHPPGNPPPPPPPPPGDAPVPVPGDATRFTGALSAGGRVTTRSGRYALTYQGDGNLVLYGPGGPLWASGTQGQTPGRAVMQGDGNLVVYESSGRPTWASHTSGAGAFLALLEDGNLAVYRADGQAVLWTRQGASTPPPPSGPATLSAGQRLARDEQLSSPDGRFRLVYQSDGNLVLYGPSGATWASNTPGTSVGSVEMQGDGNFVVYDAQGHARWSSNTAGHPGAALELGDDGVAQVRANGSVLWRTR